MTMHLPWKKSKIGRVSRFVSDLRSAKHGGSLVVETGFPTSLIDLIVKNRDRLKKSSSTSTTTKNKKKRTNNNPLEISDNSTPPPPSSSSSSSQLLPSSDSLNSTTLAIVSSPRIKNHPENEKKIPHLVQKVEEEEVAEEVISLISAPNRTFTLIMKLFFFLILAIGTKKLAIAITVLAFFLLFLEFSCSRLFFCFLKPCPNAKNRFNSVVESVVNSIHHHQKDELEEEKEEGDDQTTTTTTISESSCCRNDMFESGEDNTVSSSSSSNNSSMAKKEEQGGSSSNNEEIQMIEPGFDSLHCGCRWGFTEKSSKRIKNEDLIHENSDIRNHSRSRNNGSAKFKSKLLKKFVPKKFRQSKKKRNNNCYEDINNNNNEDDEEEEQRNLEGGDSTSDLSNSNSNSNSNSQEEAEDDEKSYRGGEQQDKQLEKHKNDSDDEHKKSGYVSQIEHRNI